MSGKPTLLGSIGVRLFQRTKTHYPHSIFARHDPNSKEANTLWMLGSLAGVVEPAHRCFSTVSVQEKPSFLIS